VNHEIEVSNLAFNKTSNENVNFKKYEINIDLEEESSSEEQTMLKYSLDLTSEPKNSVISISGNAVLNGTQTEIESYLKQDEDKVPAIVATIYQELFPLMYIISKDMKIPAPAHTISQNNVIDEPVNSEIESESQAKEEIAEESVETPIENSPEVEKEVEGTDEPVVEKKIEGVDEPKKNDSDEINNDAS